MSKSRFRFAPIALSLVAIGARADTLADWADKTTEIATDGPNTIRTMALAQNAVYEAVNSITSRYPHDRVDRAWRPVHRSTRPSQQQAGLCCYMKHRR